MEPVVSIIIPVGPGHGHYLPDALHSVMAQPVTAWEALVINDTGAPLELPAMPGVRVLGPPIHPSDSPGTSRAARNRNAGLMAARAPWAVCLDADDALMPDALGALLRGAEEQPEAGYIYGSWWNLRADGHLDFAAAPRYDRAKLLHSNLHPITALIPVARAREVGGFDPQWEVFEDWEFWLRLGMSGCCGHAIPDPILIYRTGAGGNRMLSAERKAEIAALRGARYGAMLRGEETPVGCCSNSSKRPGQGAQGPLAAFGAVLGGARSEGPMAAEERVRMQAPAGFSGTARNPFTAGTEAYRVTAANPYISAAPQDVGWLTERGFVEVRRPDTRPPPRLAPTVAPPPASLAADGDLVAAGSEAESAAPRAKGRKADK